MNNDEFKVEDDNERVTLLINGHPFFVLSREQWVKVIIHEYKRLNLGWK